MTAREQLLLSDNFVWAWHKVRRFYETTDVWYDELEVAAFESCLQENLNNIRGQFERGRYALSAITPLPQPKKTDDEGAPQVRQSFWVPVADQVAWVAYVNVIGPLAERAMPAWSYGNRLYRTTWYEDPLNHEHLHLGPFRNAPGMIYKPFRQSWAPFRRRIYLTVRAMTPPRFRKEIALDEPDLQTERQEKNLRDAWRLPYLKPGFWTRPAEKTYWASLDLKHFYQSVHLDVIRANVRKFAPEAVDITGSLLDDLLHFPLDLREWNDQELKAMSLTSKQSRYSQIPTGLMVAGFLANVAMLPVDDEVSTLVKPSQIAHFRYVDDHVILAKSFDSLLAWIERYKTILSERNIGAELNNGKFQPRELTQWFSAPGKYTREQVSRACELDPRFPSPLMTKTLLKVSEIARTNFDLLDAREERVALDDLEHLLLTDFPEEELPAPTRVSFAATRIARIASERFGVLAATAELDRKLNATERDTDRVALRQKIKQRRRERERQDSQERSRVFALLLESVRQYPEKLRLWARVLEFCRASGHADLGLLIKELSDRCKQNEVGCRVLRARVLQTLAMQIVRCSQSIVSGDEAPWRQAAARRYLRAIPAYAEKIGKSIPNPKHYERTSIELCSGAAGIAVVLLGDDYSKQMAPVSPLNWSHADPVWVWWSETVLRSGGNLEPGPIWVAASKHLSANDPIAAGVLARYRATPATQKNNLYQWCAWTRRRSEQSVHWFDPRCGEWTALKVVIRLVDLILERNTGVSPEKVFVPDEWQESVDLSWHEWTKLFSDGSAIDALPSPPTPSLQSVRDVSIILLGLLRRDLRWPADWNSPGPQYSSEHLVRSLIADARASSWTSAILEACLLPQHRETLLNLFLTPHVPADDDVARRPLMIRTPKRLRQYLDLARKVLERFQMTVQAGQPRQLIPMHIDQISREEWAVQANGEFEPEDNDD